MIAKTIMAVIMGSCYMAANATTLLGTDYATVVSSEPRNGYLDHQVCEPTESRGMTGAIIGGVAGGLLGNQVGQGRGREAATAAGAVVGALTGERLQNNQQQTCRVVRTVVNDDGFDTSLNYKGRLITIRTTYQVRRGTQFPVRIVLEEN